VKGNLNLKWENENFSLLSGFKSTLQHWIILPHYNLQYVLNLMQFGLSAILLRAMNDPFLGMATSL